MKNCLIIQHTDITSAGSSYDWLMENSIPFHVWKISSQAQPDLSKFDGLIICGGEPNVDEEDKYPWLKQEKEIIKNWIHRDAPVLGLCLGGQLIADVLGAHVGPHQGWEVGWHKVKTSDGDLMGFQYHQYKFLLPSGTKSIAEGEYCPHQGFLLRKLWHFNFIQNPQKSGSFIVQIA